MNLRNKIQGKFKLYKYEYDRQLFLVLAQTYKSNTEMLIDMTTKTYKIIMINMYQL